MLHSCIFQENINNEAGALARNEEPIWTSCGELTICLFFWVTYCVFFLLCYLLDKLFVLYCVLFSIKFIFNYKKGGLDAPWVDAPPNSETQQSTCKSAHNQSILSHVDITAKLIIAEIKSPSAHALSQLFGCVRMSLLKMHAYMFLFLSVLNSG